MPNVDIEIKAFFFNAKTDYLPYYKPFEFNVAENTKLVDILALIKEQERNFSYPSENLLFRLNGLVTDGDKEIGEVVKTLGNELTIEPISTYRATNGLVIDDSDFLEQFNKLPKEVQTAENLDYYKSLYAQHYASETFKYKKDYIGDAIILLAHKLIVEDNSEYKEQILEVVNDFTNGIRYCEYENNILFGEDQESKIEEIKSMLTLKDELGFLDKIASLTIKHKQHDIDTIGDSNIAIYVGNNDNITALNELKTFVENEGIKVINFDYTFKKAGQSLLNYNREMASKKAGKVMLDAFDNGADIFICLNDSDVTYFRTIQGYSERELGRDINIKIISVDTLKNLLQKASVN